MVENNVEFMRPACLPPDIWLGMRAREEEAVSGDGNSGAGPRRSGGKRAGRELIRQIVCGRLGNRDLRFETDPNGKPLARLDGNLLHISISHTARLICGAVSVSRVLGIDLEAQDRNIHPLLRKRILHPEEADIAAEIPTLRLWTFKEAALKWSGTGLRTPMNSLRLLDAGGPLCLLALPDGKRLDLCGISLRGHWMAIAWEHGSQAAGSPAGLKGASAEPGRPRGSHERKGGATGGKTPKTRGGES